MKNIIKMIIAAIIAFPFLAYITLLLFVPISRSDNSVRNYVLRKIPVGTSWEDAVKIIHEKHWDIEQTDVEHGLLIFDSAGSVKFATDYAIELSKKVLSESRVAGTKSMYVELGEYNGPFDTAVYAYIAFDENNGLVDVVIKRYIDAL